MRVPFNDQESFSIKINTIDKKIRDNFFFAMLPHITMKETDVMLGDGTISKVGTFDVLQVKNYFFKIMKLLDEWNVSDISTSNTDDLHRMYFQISKVIKKYYIYGYFGIQYHEIPYYKVDKRVNEIRNELFRMTDRINEVSNKIGSNANEIIENELQKYGYQNPSIDAVLENLYDNPDLMESIEKKVSVLESKYPELKEVESRKKLELELNQMIIKLNNISNPPKIIDYNRLMQGEEGVISYFEIEKIRDRKNKSRDPLIDTKKITPDDSNNIIIELQKIDNIIEKTIIHQNDI